MTAVLLAARGGFIASNLYSVDPATAVETSIGPVGFALTGIAQDPTTGIIYGLTSSGSPAHPNSLITIDPTTGAGTFLFACSGPNQSWSDIAFDSAGQMYAQGQSVRLIRVDKTTGIGVASFVGFSASVIGGAFSIDSTDTGWAIPSGVNGGNLNILYKVDFGTNFYIAWAGPPLTWTPYGSAISPALAFDAADVLWAVVTNRNNRWDLATVDIGTGVLTNIGPLNILTDALAWVDITTTTDDFSVDLTPDSLSICAGFDDTTALSTTITSGVAQSVTLSDTGAPAGVSLAYTTNPIMSGAGTTVTVTVGGAVAPGVYPIVIHAVGTVTTHTTTLTLTVPGPVDDAYPAYQSHTLNVAAPGVMTNDIDPTTVTLNTGTTHGTVTLNPDGSFSYTPDPGYLGTDSFTYDGHCGTATVTLTITARDPTGVFSGEVGFHAWSA